MNAPKKPGTDLSALKARLAKKDAPAAPEPAAPAAAAPAAKAPARPPFKKAAPAGDVPPPGEPAAIPPPGETVPLDIPAPGEVALPPQPQPVAAAAPVAAPAPRKAIDDGTPFGASAGSFDPNAGLIADAGGDVAPRGNKGIVVLAAGGALAFGLILGWIGHQIISKGDLRDQAKKKGEAMLVEVQKVSDMRKGISLKLADMKKNAFAEPAKAEAELNALGEEHFKKVPNVEELFGWQLAGIGKEGIRRTFALYEEATRLATDLRLIKQVISANGAALAGEGAPRAFAIKFKKEGAFLVERGAPICGEKECDDPKAEPSAYNIRESAGQPFAPAPIGKEEGQVLPLEASGQIYTLAIGLKPETNARTFLEVQFAQLQGHLDEMAKAETRALKALQSYSTDPNVDGSGPADPGAD